MTETSSLFTTSSISHHQNPIAAPPTSVSPVANGTVSDANLPDEEEYTIKCICTYDDDDGNTVYCEKCDTWQHILCYYYGQKVPDLHFCTECEPRNLDARGAANRQRKARAELEGGDRKIKKPASKTSKKKQKEPQSALDQPNGWTGHDRHDSVNNARDHPPPAKKPKTSHRTSASIVSLNGESRKRGYSNQQSYPSPSRSPTDLYRFPIIPQYTPEFLELYDRDDGNTDAPANTHTMPGADLLSQWKRDPSLVVNGTDQQPNPRAPFVHASEDMDQMQWPRVSVETKTGEGEVNGKRPMWRYIRLQQNVKKDHVLGEVRGQVGTLEEWCSQVASPNRWAELQHPDPFVFFHPHMNVYIDSRKQGTSFRYLRRSCQPNVTLKTFVSDDGQSRHCFVANRDISAGSELTVAWYLNPSMFDLNGDGEDYEKESRRCDWISRVLANFGDCACDKTQCPFARLDRRSSLQSTETTSKQAAGRKRKAKSKQALSPLSTGQATNSRAGSEAVRAPEEDDQFDGRSNSESTHSGVASRDMTPTNVAMLDADPILGTGLTARELRKLRALEHKETKRSKAERAGVTKKKKQRTSGGSNATTPNPTVSKQPSVPTETEQFPSQLQAGRSSTPKSSNRSSAASRPVYVDSSTQTEPCDIKLSMQDQGLRERMAAAYIPRHQRLLGRIHMFSQTKGSEYQQKHGDPRDRGFPDGCGGYIPYEQCYPRDGIVSTNVYPMSSFWVGSEAAASYNTTEAAKRGLPMPPPRHPLPSQAAHTQAVFKLPTAPRLHLSTLPSVPSFASTGTSPPISASGAGMQMTPVLAQSPSILSANVTGFFAGANASVVSPSPVKKKLSLGDYTRRRNLAATPITEKSQSQAIGESGENGDEANRRSSTAASEDVDTTALKAEPAMAAEAVKRGSVDSSAVEDIPIKGEDGATDISSPSASNAAVITTKAESPPPGAAPVTLQGTEDTANSKVAGVMASLAEMHRSYEKARSQSAGSTG